MEHTLGSNGSAHPALKLKLVAFRQRFSIYRIDWNTTHKHIVCSEGMEISQYPLTY